MQCKICQLNTLKSYKYVVVLSVYQNKLMLSRHRARTTWETQGGHIEPGEAPLDAARRELYEESGARDFDIAPAFDYWAADDTSGANGMVFVANIHKLADMPSFEMKEVALFDELPEQLTYPDITPVLLACAREQKLL